MAKTRERGHKRSIRRLQGPAQEFFGDQAWL
jgi:hypothetical protein